SIHALGDGELSVFSGDDAFDEQLDGNQVAQPLQEFPIRGSRVKRSHFRDVKAIEHGLAFDVARKTSIASAAAARVSRISAVASRAIALIGTLALEQRLAIAAFLEIDSQRDRWAARCFSALDHGAIHLPDIVRIELLPNERSATSSYDILYRR